MDQISEDLKTFHRLVQTSDVVVETVSPSSRYQALVDHDSPVSLNPRLVHCSITAYGSDGPLRDEPPIDGAAPTLGTGWITWTGPGRKDGWLARIPVRASKFC